MVRQAQSRGRADRRRNRQSRLSPNAVECTKGRFFDRANDKLSQLARFATNELVSVDVQAMAAALSSLS
jgi:hypothetical protein